MTIKQKKDNLQKIFWDYNLSGEELYSILLDKRKSDYIGKERIFIRMLERLGWYDILEIMGVERVKSTLTESVIVKIYHQELRERYEFIRKVLFGEAVSFSGWGDAYYQKIKHTLFSDRWYRSQPTLL